MPSSLGQRLWPVNQGGDGLHGRPPHLTLTLRCSRHYATAFVHNKPLIAATIVTWPPKISLFAISANSSTQRVCARPHARVWICRCLRRYGLPQGALLLHVGGINIGVARASRGGPGCPLLLSSDDSAARQERDGARAGTHLVPYHDLIWACLADRARHLHVRRRQAAVGPHSEFVDAGSKLPPLPTLSMADIE